MDALQELDTIAFQVNQHKSVITTGDTVLIWVSGYNAGIYAKASIIEAPGLIEEDAADKKFWVKNNTNSNRVKTRCILTIEQKFLTNPLLKTKLLEYTSLKNLSIIRNPMGTNFKVTSDEWNFIKQLLINL